MTRKQSIENRVSLLNYLKELREYNGTVNYLSGHFRIARGFVPALAEMGIVKLTRKKVEWIGTEKPFKDVAIHAMRRENSMREEGKGSQFFARPKSKMDNIYARKRALKQMFEDYQNKKQEKITEYYRRWGIGTYFIRALEQEKYMERSNGSFSFFEFPENIPVEKVYKIEREIRKAHESDSVTIDLTKVKPPEKSINPAMQETIFKAMEKRSNALENIFKFGAMVGARKGLREISRAMNMDTLDVLATAKELNDKIDTSYLISEGRDYMQKIIG